LRNIVGHATPNFKGFVTLFRGVPREIGKLAKSREMSRRSRLSMQPTFFKRSSSLLIRLALPKP
jgi:hypothetical protein